MCLNFPVLLVQKYLEVNGYFVLLNYHVHDVSGRVAYTDVDVIAVRFPNTFERPLGASWLFKYHDLLIPPQKCIDIILGEVKEGTVRRQADLKLRRPEVIKYALNRIGLFDEETNSRIADVLQNRERYICHVNKNMAVMIRKIIFCLEGSVDGFITIHFKNIVDYMYKRFKEFNIKLGVHYEDPILSFFKLAERLERRNRYEDAPHYCLFAYGALMNKEELAKRLNSNVEELDKRLKFFKAVLNGRRRVCNVYSHRWRGYVYNLCKDKRGIVEGVLICNLTHEDILRIDRYEGPYIRKRVRVWNVDENREIETFVYIYEEKKHTKEGEISPSYYEVVLQAAKEFNLKL